MRVVVEADGGSRGNPGPAAYGAVLKDADTGAVLAEEGTTIGVATNNVAEYSGLIAGLRLAAELAPGATVEVRMDSKLVVEQMSGRWQVKHPAMKPLAAEARRLAPPGTAYTWVPRAENAHADRLANEALDGKRSGVAPAAILQAPTTVILLRHGVTPHTTARRFSGGLGGDNPGLSDEGRTQVSEAAAWLTELGDRIAAVVASPVRRTRESADIAGEALGLEVVEDAGFAEMEFGAWDGLTFAEVTGCDQAAFDRWLADLTVAPPGGESFRTVEARVLAGLDRLLTTYAGRTVLVVSHVTPIKTLVAHALGTELSAVFAMELSPASISVLSFYPDGTAPLGRRGSLRLYNAIAPGSRSLIDNGRW